MSRREFIALLGGAAVAWPLAGRAQDRERLRRVGMLMVAVAGDQEMSRRLAALQGELGRLGWVEGRNLRFETRWAAGDPERIRNAATELVALAPDLIVANGSSAMDAMQRATRSVPVVFVVVPDPIGAGYADSLARPGGNATGFSQFEFGIGAKWLELLKELAPGVKRVGVIRDPGITAGTGQFGAIQSAAPSFGVELTPLNVRDPAEIERVITAFARIENGGMIVTGSALAVVHRQLIIALAATHKLPAVYFADYHVKEGGLASYGPDLVDQYRQAASYVDRILKGEKPADLPVQSPTKYETVINLKTAKAIGLTVPDSVLARADEVIE
jgi:putative tryptophan/tyrosine transport system substrate-binding protein